MTQSEQATWSHGTKHVVSVFVESSSKNTDTFIFCQSVYPNRSSIILIQNFFGGQTLVFWHTRLLHHPKKNKTIHFLVGTEHVMHVLHEV